MTCVLGGLLLVLFPELRPAFMLSDRAQVEICYEMHSDRDDLPQYCLDWERRKVMTCIDSMDSVSSCSPDSAVACKVSPYPESSARECRASWAEWDREEKALARRRHRLIRRWSTAWCNVRSGMTQQRLHRLMGKHTAQKQFGPKTWQFRWSTPAPSNNFYAEVQNGKVWATKHELADMKLDC